MGVVLITHYQRLLDEVTPDVVHVMIDGPHRRVGRDGARRAGRRAGYESFRDRRGGAVTSADRRRRRRTLDDVDAASATAQAALPPAQQEIDGAPIHYLDSANTSQKPSR